MTAELENVTSKRPILIIHSAYLIPAPWPRLPRKFDYETIILK